MGLYKFFIINSVVWAYYFGEYSIYFSLLAGLICLFSIKTISKLSIGIIAGILILNLLKYLDSEVPVHYLFRDLRFYWGFIIYYLFFNSEKTVNGNLNNYANFYNKIIPAILALLFLEFISLNIFNQVWPNNHSMDLGNEMQSGLVRASGFGGSPTVTVVLLIALSSRFNRSILYDLFGILFTMSGMGALLIYLKILYKNKITIKIICFFTIIFLFFLILAYGKSYFPSAQKLSFEYLKFVYFIKLDQIINYYQNTKLINFFIGDIVSYQSSGTGDFSLLDQFRSNGILGTAIFISLILKSNNKFTLPIFILLLGSAHYPAIFSICGSMIFSFLLIDNSQKGKNCDLY